MAVIFTLLILIGMVVFFGFIFKLAVREGIKKGNRK